MNNGNIGTPLNNSEPSTGAPVSNSSSTIARLPSYE